MADTNVYVYNKHNAPIITNARDEKGKKTYSKAFLPERRDITTSRVVSTGYTTLTKEEYKELCDTSKTFRHFKDVLELLVVQDDLPPEAKTPHEALVDARRKEREAAASVAAAQAEITALKAQLLDADVKYKQLSSASTDDEKFAPLNERITVLEKERDGLLKAQEEKRLPEDRTVELTKQFKEFVDEVLKLVGKDKRVKELVDAFVVKIGATATEKRDFD